MTKRLSKLVLSVAVVSLVSLLAAQSASAVTIITFGQNVQGSPVTATDLAGVTTITGTNIGVNITQIEGGAATSAFLTFTLTSSGAAVNVAGTLIQAYSGSFSITDGALNFLSGTFGLGTFTGLNGAASGTFSVAEPPSTLSFTENQTITSTLIPLGFSLSFASISPGLSIAGNTIDGFTSSVSGTASGTAEQLDVVPEPGSMLLLGSGLMGLAAAARRRRQARK